MNEKLARTLGIKFVRKQSHGGKRNGCDVIIRKLKGNRYNISFSDSVANKLGTHVRLAVGNRRIWIVSGCADEYGYKISKKNGTRGYVLVSVSAIGYIDAFLGDHELLYSSDMDAYYITEKGEYK